MSEFTPSNENLRDAWREVRPGRSCDEARAEFDRWLAAHDQGIRDAAKPPAMTAREHLEAVWGAAYPMPEEREVPAHTPYIIRWTWESFLVEMAGCNVAFDADSRFRTLDPLPPLIPDDCNYVWASVPDDRGDRSIWARTSDGRWESRMPRSNCTVRYPEDDLIDPKPVPEEER